LSDNQGAISLAKNPTHHAKMKHIDVHSTLSGIISKRERSDVEYCPTENMLADVMTKGLTCKRHERLLRLMGVGLSEETAMPSRVGKIECHRMEIKSGSEELRNSHGDAIVGSSYLSYSNCDVVKAAL